MKNKYLEWCCLEGIGMGNKPVIIKGTKDGITIILEENSNFEDVEKIIYEKLQSGRNFLSGVRVLLKIRRRVLV